MKSSADARMPSPRRLGLASRRIVLLLAVVIVIVIGASLRQLADLWTTQMWFSQAGFGQVWTTMFQTKVALATVVGLLFALVLWINMMLTDRFGARVLTQSPEDDIVRRFQNAVRPRARWIYAAAALVMGFLAGLQASSQWQTWLLFLHRQNFATTDPIFHKNVGFYIFTLPFYNAVVTWLLVILFVAFFVSTLLHFLNGGIRTSSQVGRSVAPAVKVHLSILGALIALAKAGGYLVAKWHLVVATDAYVQGAGYTDVHARMPALTVLFYLSLAAAVILLANIRSRGWSLPVLAVGLWAFVALVIGVIYPAIMQRFEVGPAQATREAPYIADNIAATREAYNLTSVHYVKFAGSNTISKAQLKFAHATLDNIRLWDPDPSIALASTQRLQSLRSFYTFTSLGVDRYPIGGKITPVLVGAREISARNLPSQSWVNTHLQYTHGTGVALLAANTLDTATGDPVYDVSDIPAVSVASAPPITNPSIYFGSGESGWVVANTKQPEFDYQITSGTQAGQDVVSHYAGKGGVAVGGLLPRLALAVRLGDLNVLISNQITPRSRVLFIRDVTQMAQTAAPFLSFDSSPYAVINNGQVDFVLDGYTTSTQFPYSENASNFNVTPSGLPANVNYVRNAVKVVINAYSGKMTYYVMDHSDPLIRAYAAIFPGMFQPLSAMPASLQQHLRYPQDLFALRAAALGRYHITTPSDFYTASDQWEVSPSSSAGATSNGLAATTVTDPVTGQTLTSTLLPMAPTYQVGALPGESQEQLLETVAFVPSGNSSTVQSLTAFMTATSNPNNYGTLHVYETPRGQSVTGLAQAESEMQQNATVSKWMTSLDQHGSQVLLGNTLLVPIGQSVLYVRPMYVEATSNPLPQLKYVITAFNQSIGFGSSLSSSLSQVLGGNVSAGTPSPSRGGSTGATHNAAYYLAQATADYTAAQTALHNGNLGLYQSDVAAMNREIGLAATALAK